MYKRRKKKISVWKPVCLLAVLIQVTLVSLYMAASVSAAPEEQAVEAVAEAIRLQEERAAAAAVKAAEEQGRKAQAADAGMEGAAQYGKMAEAEGKAGLLIVIDPGHGGLDEGCSALGVLEKEINLSIARLLKEKLEALEYRVLLAREEDDYIAKEERVERANAAGADAYISIHQNTWKDGAVSGMETWYDGTDPAKDSYRLARLVHSRALGSTGAADREVKEDAALCVTGKTAMPSCLIETGFLSNTTDRELLVTEEYQEKIAAGIAEGIELYFHPKTMYLTFDDGPSEENTGAVLDTLKKNNIKATFFVIGESVRKHPEVARRIVAEGHTIGIHCNNHAYETLYESADSYLEDFEKAFEAVREVTGVEAKLFRFPGGSVNSYNRAVREEIVEKMTEKGFIYYDWNASLEDAVKHSEPAKLIENAKETTQGRKKVVMLAHDVVHSTTLCLEELLEQFPEYEMKPLTQEVEPIQFKMEKTSGGAGK